MVTALPSISLVPFEELRVPFVCIAHQGFEAGNPAWHAADESSCVGLRVSNRERAAGSHIHRRAFRHLTIVLMSSYCGFGSVSQSGNRLFKSDLMSVKWYLSRGWDQHASRVGEPLQAEKCILGSASGTLCQHFGRFKPKLKLPFFRSKGIGKLA